jgi:hypothetical protein
MTLTNNTGFSSKPGCIAIQSCPIADAATWQRGTRDRRLLLLPGIPDGFREKDYSTAAFQNTLTFLVSTLFLARKRS